MAPPKSTTTSKKSPPAMKQGKLNFSVKRVNSAAGADKKGKPKQTPSNSPVVIEDIDNDGKVSGDNETERLSPPSEGRALKKRKLDDSEASDSVDGRKPKAIFKSRTSLENASDEKTSVTEEKEPRPKLNVKDKRWQRAYTQAKQRTGGAKPIHNEGKNKIHDILRVFDLSYEYGPCIGVTRLDRWQRAEALGLKPSPEIRDILMTEEGVELPEYRYCVFHEDV